MEEFPCDHPALQPLFAPDLPNSPALWAVLKGKHAGKALVDDPHHPGECVLRSAAALSYIGWQTSPAFLAEALAIFRQTGPVWLVWPPQTGLQPPDPGAAEIEPRLEFFELDPDSDALERWKRRLPDGHHISAIDARLFERCLWRDEMAFYAGSIANFLAHGMGVCLMKGDQIVAEAYASALGKNTAEIGAITWEPYRGRGYAPVASAYLIEACRQQGYQPTWSCDAGHTASIRVAQKLGFRQMRPYNIFDYPQFQPSLEPDP